MRRQSLGDARPVGALRMLHALRPMVARDPDEGHRTASTFELLYDLTLVVAFSMSGVELAHALSAGHIIEGLAAFGFVQFAVVWAWISYSWFASAYDTDDWGVRLVIALQMIGVLILAIGIGDLFKGFAHGWEMRNSILVLGYVVMRVGMIALWLRTARANPNNARTSHMHAAWIAILQVVWIGTTFVGLHALEGIVVGVVLLTAELCGPAVIERTHINTTWHAHHLAERFSLLALITVGEVVVGTATAVQALYTKQGWNVEDSLVLVAGVSLAMGVWWMYSEIPFGRMLEKHPERVFLFVYSHFVIYGAIAAVGAGLHVAALFLEGHTELVLVGVVLSIVVPLAVFDIALFGVAAWLNPMPQARGFHALLLGISAVVLIACVLLAAAGASFPVCLAVALLSPWVTVGGIETVGHRHIEQALEHN